MEVLQNLHKHERYTCLRIRISNSEQTLHIEFKYDGRGVTDKDIDAFSARSTGLGLQSLKSRLQILNATIHYSKEQNAARIHIAIPFSA